MEPDMKTLVRALVVLPFFVATCAQAEIFTHGQRHHRNDAHRPRHVQRWDFPHSGMTHRDTMRHGPNYVRHSGPRFNGPHWDR